MRDLLEALGIGMLGILYAAMALVIFLPVAIILTPFGWMGMFLFWLMFWR